MFGNKHRMSQKGDESSNLQAGRDVVVYNGMSPAEVSTVKPRGVVFDGCRVILRFG